MKKNFLNIFLTYWFWKKFKWKYKGIGKGLGTLNYLTKHEVKMINLEFIHEMELIEKFL